MRGYHVGADLIGLEDAWRARYRDAAAVLVRPDGYVAWCADGDPADPGAEVADVLYRVLHTRVGPHGGDADRARADLAVVDTFSKQGPSQREPKRMLCTVPVRWWTRRSGAISAKGPFLTT
ncbi:aromatic-ring hydroxylase C-terminal domain-containing protein [Nonomuraea sp. SYSU D8015]|uniref:aromatic-ring hydroxylase C-terminal domain-containing protein n=1 Tax=Nonomuraea sp. SYSU D8015 TaxID=2593644 RepID=UPI003FA52758